MTTTQFTHAPEKLVPGKYNIVATRRDEAAILWKDGEFFVIALDHPDEACPISESMAYGIDAKGQFVTPDPIPLDDLSEWRERAGEVRIPLLPIEEQLHGVPS